MRALFALLLALLVASASVASAATLGPGNYDFTLKVDDRVREYFVHIPPQGSIARLPVLILLHGGGGSAGQFRRDANLDEAADRNGYIAVYPNGSGRLQDRLLTWNAGTCCAYAMEHRVDDVAFIGKVIDDLAQRANVDLRRVYVAGHSNGGMMAHRLGGALPGRIAAIASMAGAALPPEAAGGPGRAVPALHIHSVDDPRALYQGGLGPAFPLTRQRSLHQPVAEVLATWVKRDGCAPQPMVRDKRKADKHSATLLIWPRCRDGAEVAHWKLTGAGHGWAGGRTVREGVIGPATRVIDANTEIWRFVSRFSLPE